MEISYSLVTENTCVVTQFHGGRRGQDPGWGLLLYIGNIGMCRWIGYCFKVLEP